MNNRVGKRFLVDYLCAELGMTETKANEAVNGVLEGIASALRCEVNVAISNIGTLRFERTGERTARNPQTGERVLVPAQNVVRWTMSPTLRDVLNDRSERQSLASKAPKTVKAV